MKKVNDTIENAAPYSSGDALKLFSQCAEIQLTLRVNFMTSLSSHVLGRHHCTSTRPKMSESINFNSALVFSKMVGKNTFSCKCCPIDSKLSDQSLRRPHEETLGP